MNLEEMQIELDALKRQIHRLVLECEDKTGLVVIGIDIDKREVSLGRPSKMVKIKIEIP